MIRVYLKGHDFKYHVGELIKLFTGPKQVSFVNNECLITKDNTDLFLISEITYQNKQYTIHTKIYKEKDLIYCDPPYIDSQSIVYGSQTFNIYELIEAIFNAKNRDVRIALSIDGTKKSGNHQVKIELPESLFETEIIIDAGRSMLRRFQKAGKTLEDEVVGERLLLTYPLE